MIDSSFWFFVLFCLGVVALGCVVALLVALLWWAGILLICRAFRSEPTRAMMVTAIAVGVFTGVMASVGAVVYLVSAPES